MKASDTQLIFFVEKEVLFFITHPNIKKYYQALGDGFRGLFRDLSI